MTGFREALRTLPDAVFVDLMESDDAHRLVLDLPGVTPETADVTVEDGVLHVDARREKAVPSGFTYRREERSLFLDVDLPLPPDATEDGATATLADGVLTVTLPKAASQGRRIDVEG